MQCHPQQICVEIAARPGRLQFRTLLPPDGTSGNGSRKHTAALCQPLRACATHVVPASGTAGASRAAASSISNLKSSRFSLAMGHVLSVAFSIQLGHILPPASRRLAGSTGWGGDIYAIRRGLPKDE